MDHIQDNWKLWAKFVIFESGANFQFLKVQRSNSSFWTLSGQSIICITVRTFVQILQKPYCFPFYLLIRFPSLVRKTKQKKKRKKKQIKKSKTKRQKGRKRSNEGGKGQDLVKKTNGDYPYQVVTHWSPLDLHHDFVEVGNSFLASLYIFFHFCTRLQYL